MSDAIVAIDVGGTAIKCALVTPQPFTVHHTEDHPSHAERGPDAVVNHILDIAAGLAEQAKHLELTPRAVGVVVPGIVDEDRGVATYAANLGWRDVPLRDLVSERLGVPATVGHDVRGGGLAEVVLGAGRGFAQVLFVPIGTGIAAAHLVAGRPFQGAHGAACELGHVVVRPGGRQCGCGRRGCLEAEASAKAVATRYQEATGDAVSAADVASRAASGDATARGVWHDAIAALADGLLTAVTLFDPDVIVLGGGLAEAGDHLLDPLTTELTARVTFEQVPRLVPAVLGKQAGCFGAALLAASLTADRPAAGDDRSEARPVARSPHRQAPSPSSPVSGPQTTPPPTPQKE